jgi:two-component system sensor kinase FixL
VNQKVTNSSSNAFDALMDAAVDAIIIIDHLGLIQQFNHAAEGIFGYSEDYLMGRNVRLLMPDPHHSQHDQYIARYRETGIAAIIGTGREVEGLKKDGSTFPMFLSVGEIFDKGGNRFVGIIKDLSEVRQSSEQVRNLEEQLLHADRLVILGELTAGIAHEINQPLTAIAAYADAGRNLAAREEDIPLEDLRSLYERIAQQSRRAAAVVQRLRKLVRSGTVSKSRNNINHTIKNILLLFEYEIKKTEIELNFYPLESLPELYLDEVHIQQIMVNLVKNALDAIMQSGQQQGKIEIRLKKNMADVLISVTDNGPGVAEAHRSRLFESFFTTKPTGIGLGLSICKNIAGAHGGNLRYSRPRKGGSCFTLSLPLEFIG